jgi:hypothetical protein
MLELRGPGGFRTLSGNANTRYGTHRTHQLGSQDTQPTQSLTLLLVCLDLHQERLTGASSRTHWAGYLCDGRACFAVSIELSSNTPKPCKDECDQKVTEADNSRVQDTQLSQGCTRVVYGFGENANIIKRLCRKLIACTGTIVCMHA